MLLMLTHIFYHAHIYSQTNRYTPFVICDTLVTDENT